MFPSNDLVFQHAKLTINFQKEGSVLIPILENDKTIVLRGEETKFDASKSYITYRNDSERYNGISFQWICPDDLAFLCSGQTNSSLIINST